MAKYVGGYKYQLQESSIFYTEVYPPRYIELPFSSLDTRGTLTCYRGYAWDGATLAIDSKNCMQASLCHDALYQFIAHGLLSAEWREQADKELVKVARKNGMSKFRSSYVYWAVRTFGGRYLREKKILEA